MAGKVQNTLARHLFTAARLALSLGLLALIVKSVDWHEIARALVDVSPTLLVATSLLYYVGIGLSCWKWWLLLGLERIKVEPDRLPRWYLIGAFASNFLPTDIGGDLSRGYLASRATGQPIGMARSIIMERLTGLLFMALLAWAGTLVLLPWRGVTMGLSVAGLVAFAMLGVSWGRGQGRLVGWGTSLTARLPARLQELVFSTREVARRGRCEPATLTLILLLSLIIQLQAGFGLWVNLYAVGVQLPIMPVVLAAALAGVIGLLPVSMNGWGVREAVLVALLGPLGASPAGIVAGSLLGRAVMFVLSAVGAALIPFEGKWREKPQAEIPPPLK